MPNHAFAFVVDEPTGPRFELAFDRFREGHAFEFRDVAVRLERDGYLLCTVDSSWGSDAITAATAIKDFEDGTPALEFLVTSSPVFGPQRFKGARSDTSSLRTRATAAF